MEESRLPQELLRMRGLQSMRLLSSTHNTRGGFMRHVALISFRRGMYSSWTKTQRGLPTFKFTPKARGISKREKY